YTASDLSGNTTSKSFNVTVVDNNPPVFSFCPSSSNDISTDTTTRKSVISWEIPVAEDACSDISMSSNYNPGEEFDYGNITVVYTATDLSGNVAQCSFDITPGINLPPVIDDLWINAEAGIPIDIQMEATDPEGDQVFIKSIMNNENNSTISNVDDENLRFVYTSSEDFYGYDTLKVTVIDSGLPTASASANVFIEVERNVQIDVSSAITTNGDLINDTWYIKNIDVYPNNSVRIFDRWGGLLYKTAGYDNESVAWDGTSNQGTLGNNEFVPTGTYFYVIDLGAGGKKITGAIEVIR
ncbi:MAG: gliding motility-associated C-terminal domain-containing protein, partial [Cyclobacteriaceae bacterium]|nr:gliding motility-associated C-terminal domain-containing protein [Cyclobacteriaceae bacterium]